MPQTAEPLASFLRVEVDGGPLPETVDALLVLAFVEDSKALPDTFELRFRDQDRIVLDQGGLQIGKQVKLGVTTGAQSAVTWLHTGEITALEVELDGRGSWTVVRGYDKSHRLQRGRKVAAFRKMSVGDIVTNVASGAGIPVGAVDSGPVLEEVIQPNLSDWEFLGRLAEDFGMQMSINNGSLSMGKPGTTGSGPAVGLVMGENLIRFRAAVTAAEHVDTVQVRTWDPTTKKALVGTKSAASSTVAAIGATPGKIASEFGAGTLTVTDTPYASTQSQVDAIATSLAEQVASAFTAMEAVVRGDPRLHSGGVIELKGVGKPFEGKFVVTSTRHVFDGEEGYQTWVTVSGREDRTLLGLVSRSSGSRRALPGLVPAIVTDTKDPKNQGRVKVRLPWMDEVLQTDWARTLQMGGKGGGGLIIPEVDDEVLVGFEQGFIERPFVLGGLYNDQDIPPEAEVEAVDGSSGAISRRSLASRSGNRIEILDKANGANGITLTTGDGKFVIDLNAKDGTIAITSGGSVEITAAGDLSLKSKGDTRIEADGNLMLNAMGDIVVDATGDIDAYAVGKASIEGGSQADLKSNAIASVSGATVEVKGGATTSISAAMVKIN